MGAQYVEATALLETMLKVQQLNLEDGFVLYSDILQVVNDFQN